MEPSARETFDGGLSAALLPVLLHKLSNATQLLASLNALLALDGGADLALSRTDDLARTSSQVEDLGWLLAALASAAGADLVMERRERAGLAIFLAALQEALRRRGVELEITPAPPELAPHAGSGWELPWGLCALLFAASEDLPRGARITLAWSLAPGGGHAIFRASGGADVRALAPRVLAKLAVAELDAGASGFELRVPAEWIARPAQA